MEDYIQLSVMLEYNHVIHLLQMKTADTVHMGIFASVTRTFYRFLGQGVGTRWLLHTLIVTIKT